MLIVEIIPSCLDNSPKLWIYFYSKFLAGWALYASQLMILRFYNKALSKNSCINTRLTQRLNFSLSRECWSFQVLAFYHPFMRCLENIHMENSWRWLIHSNAIIKKSAHLYLEKQIEIMKKAYMRKLYFIA